MDTDSKVGPSDKVLDVTGLLEKDYNRTLVPKSVVSLSKLPLYIHLYLI